MLTKQVRTSTRVLARLILWNPSRNRKCGTRFSFLVRSSTADVVMKPVKLQEGDSGEERKAKIKATVMKLFS